MLLRRDEGANLKRRIRSEEKLDPCRNGASPARH
jgi:hypothetical protein